MQLSAKQHPNVVVRVLSSFSVTTSELASSRFFVHLSDVHELQTSSKSSNELNTSSRTCFSTLRASGAARASDARHKLAIIEPSRSKLSKRRLGLTNHNSKNIRDRGFLIHDSRTSGGLFDELRLRALIFINEISHAAVDKKNLKKLRFLSTKIGVLLGPPHILALYFAISLNKFYLSNNSTHKHRRSRHSSYSTARCKVSRKGIV